MFGDDSDYLPATLVATGTWLAPPRREIARRCAGSPAPHLNSTALCITLVFAVVSLYVQVQGLVDAVEGVLFATAAAAGSATAAAAPSAQVEEARDRCLSQLEAVRVATHALPSALPAPPVGGDDAAAQDPALETLRAERDQLRAEVQRKNRDLKATLDAMRSLQADLVMIQTQRQETLDSGGS